MIRGVLALTVLSPSSRRLPLALLAVLLCLAAPVAWALALSKPWLRSTGAPAWLLLGAGVLLGFVAARVDRRRVVRVLAWFDAGLLAAFAWLFFGAAALHPQAVATDMLRAPDFTLPDDHGRFVTLSKELSHGPVLLVFYRGHW
jgi:hypothetical protein